MSIKRKSVLLLYTSLTLSLTAYSGVGNLYAKGAVATQAAAVGTPVIIQGVKSVTPGVKTIDDKLLDVSVLLPEFGGMFYDEAGDLNIYSTVNINSKTRTSSSLWNKNAKAAIIKVFGNTLFNRKKSHHRKPGKGLALSSTVKLKVLPGKYNFIQLARWRSTVENLLSIDGVEFTDLDEASNRLRIGISSTQVLDEIKLKLATDNVPLAAVIIEETEAFKPLIRLSDRIRPVKGGIQIQNNTGGICTLGFNAYKSYYYYGFLTNSHCTNVQGGVENTAFSQNLNSGTNIIGFESLDPQYFTSPWPWNCPWFKRCRYSDAIWARYNSGIATDFRRVARPVSWNRGSTTISSSRPTMTIVSETATPISGEYLDKIGRTTGWTYGRVTSTCVTVNQSGTNITLKCQNIVSRHYGSHRMAAGGDSGSIVFKWYGNTISLSGILWGGSSSRFVFSSMKYIERELGGLYTASAPARPGTTPKPPKYCSSNQTCCEPGPKGSCSLCIPKGFLCP